jgi:hypothetical protein
MPQKSVADWSAAASVAELYQAWIAGLDVGSRSVLPPSEISFQEVVFMLLRV